MNPETWGVTLGEDLKRKKKRKVPLNDEHKGKVVIDKVVILMMLMSSKETPREEARTSLTIDFAAIKLLKIEKQDWIYNKFLTMGMKFVIFLEKVTVFFIFDNIEVQLAKGNFWRVGCKS